MLLHDSFQMSRTIASVRQSMAGVPQWIMNHVWRDKVWTVPQSSQGGYAVPGCRYLISADDHPKSEMDHVGTQDLPISCATTNARNWGEEVWSPGRRPLPCCTIDYWLDGIETGENWWQLECVLFAYFCSKFKTCSKVILWLLDFPSFSNLSVMSGKRKTG